MDNGTCRRRDAGFGRRDAPGRVQAATLAARALDLLAAVLEVAVAHAMVR
jgi:hypothetical protein